MTMIEVIRWISIVMLWVAIAANLWACHKCIKTRKMFENALEDTEHMCGEYELMRNKYIELLDEQWKDINGKD
jgi:hypothetical protein